MPEGPCRKYHAWRGVRRGRRVAASYRRRPLHGRHNDRNDCTHDADVSARRNCRIRRALPWAEPGGCDACPGERATSYVSEQPWRGVLLSRAEEDKGYERAAASSRQVHTRQGGYRCVSGQSPEERRSGFLPETRQEALPPGPPPRAAALGTHPFKSPMEWFQGTGTSCEACQGMTRGKAPAFFLRRLPAARNQDHPAGCAAMISVAVWITPSRISRTST